MKQSKLQILVFLIFFSLIEVCFRLQSGSFSLQLPLLRSLIYAAFVSSFFFILNRMSKRQWITVLTIGYAFFISLYSFIQIGMKSYYGAFFSFRFLTQSVPNVQSYASDFLAFLKPSNFIYFLLFGLFTYAYIMTRKKQRTFKNKSQALSLFLLPLLIFITYFMSLFIDTQQYIESSFNLFKNPFYTESAMNQLGVMPFISSDFQYVLVPSRAIQKIDATPDTPKGELPDGPKEDPNERVIDDSIWRETFENETKGDFKAIDQFFLNQPITKRNEMTGLFKDKNLVYFLVEAFDELAIHPELTPTLYQLKTEGMYFNQFHSPQFNCATAESELISVSSLYPVVGTCTMANYYTNTNPQTIYKLFKEEGYETRSFHNWTDQFYPRTKIHPVLGSNGYKDEAQTIPKRIGGWQSDLTMMKTVVKDLNDLDSPFMSYVITSSTHFPYDKESNLGNKYLDKINKVLPDAPIDIKRYLSKAMELDASIQYLMDNLNSMDNTVLALFSDHRPFKVDGGLVSKYADNTNKGKIYDSTPMLIYTPGIKSQVVEKVSSTIDLMPTLSNLFDLNYDPRLFMGSDIFSDVNNIVIMQSGSWRDQVGIFDANKSSFTPYEEANTYTAEQIRVRTAGVKQRLAISSSIYMQGYFEERPFLHPNSND